MSISEISKKTQLDKSTLTSMLDRLERSGFIKRMYSITDRRKIIISRTEKDKKFQNQYLAVSEEMNEIFYRDFTNQEIDIFENNLEKILSNLINKEK